MAVQIINGNALEELKKLPDESIDCIITSPPYYGLRAYKGAETNWRDWQGQLGLEPTYQMYLDHLLMITDELKRVLKKTGTLFWNMGDTYVGGHIGGSIYNKEWYISSTDAIPQITKGRPQSRVKDIPEKSLMMLPERFAIGMIEQGWILRNKIVWFKPNGLPSSIKDRFTNKWEYIFFFVKSRKYYFDLDAVRKPLSDPDRMLRGVSGKRLSRQEAIDAYLGNPPKGISKPRPNIKNILLDSKYLRDRSPNGSLAGRVMRNIADGKLETFVREAVTDVNQYLKDKLRESGLTVEQLAEMTGEKETMIAHYFRIDLSGAALPSREFWDKVKDILKLDEYDKHIKEEYKSILPTFNKGANPGDVIPYHPKGDHGLGMRLPPQPWQEHAFNPKGVNPGDMINTPAVRHKSWYSNAGHEYTHNRKYDIHADGGDFMNVPTRPHTFAHFAVYPVTLIAPLVKVGCPPGGVVLDPFAGSGTTGVVAEILGRDSIMIEISKEYIDIINWRLQSENLEKEKKAIMNNNLL